MHARPECKEVLTKLKVILVPTFHQALHLNLLRDTQESQCFLHKLVIRKKLIVHTGVPLNFRHRNHTRFQRVQDLTVNRT